jgi:hypothetical protein
MELVELMEKSAYVGYREPAAPPSGPYAALGLRLGLGLGLGRVRELPAVSAQSEGRLTQGALHSVACAQC